MILQNLYNKVLGFFRQTEQEETEFSKDTACNRLRVVLMQDRTNLTPELMDRMRKELVELLSKYVEMDKEALDLSLEQDGDQVALMLSIPVIRAKDEEEIEAALKAEAEKLEEKAEEISANSEDEENAEEGSEEESQQDTDDESETRSQAVSTPEEINSSEKEENSEEGIEAK